MRRGDLVTAAVQADFGKPRPALIIQANQFAAHSSVSVLLKTSSLVDAPMLRVTVEPGGRNGVLCTSQVMMDKTMTIRRDKLGQVVGRLEDDVMAEVERRLAIFLGVAK